jgi:hypothetical protein
MGENGASAVVIGGEELPFSFMREILLLGSLLPTYVYDPIPIHDSKQAA